MSPLPDTAALAWLTRTAQQTPGASTAKCTPPPHVGARLSTVQGAVEPGIAAGRAPRVRRRHACMVRSTQVHVLGVCAGVGGSLQPGLADRLVLDDAGVAHVRVSTATAGVAHVRVSTATAHRPKRCTGCGTLKNLGTDYDQFSAVVLQLSKPT